MHAQGGSRVDYALSHHRLGNIALYQMKCCIFCIVCECIDIKVYRLHKRKKKQHVDDYDVSINDSMSLVVFSLQSQRQAYVQDPLQGSGEP